ncbi:MAG: HpcH/HpaI aldolase/citrate lyase family protein [Clostridiales bacterium]|nr:HpcH/HpaI aldolase/citrate lyase family protein [Clostridiales bacterium]
MTNPTTNDLPFRVGALLYTPALREGIADKLEKNAYPCLSSLALCLEDSIRDSALAQAERAACRTLAQIGEKRIPPERLPLIFLRIRSPEHMAHIHAMLGADAELLTGYILPKFDLANGHEYLRTLERLPRRDGRPLYAMPILESRMIAEVGTRRHALLHLKDLLDAAGPAVLNVRVGGNDLSNLYGLRRTAAQSVYDIGVIRDVLMDILNVFTADYLVSAPVWEYFGHDPEGAWAEGLRRELALDRMNGFIGKSAVHPAQLPLIRESLRVSRADYQDAAGILHWGSAELGVAKSLDGSRMNEVKCHGRWAARVRALGDLYGFREEAAPV